MGRTQALHPPAFLVDQHRRVIPTDAVTQLAHQIPHLIGSIHVAGEQDEAQRIDAGEKNAVRPRSGSGRHSRKWRRREWDYLRTTMHPWLRFFSSPHT